MKSFLLCVFLYGTSSAINIKGKGVENVWHEFEPHGTTMQD